VSGDLDGFRVLGRSGVLGVVAAAEQPERNLLIVRGGVSGALTYHVPLDHVRTVSPETRTVHLDLDVTDFVPSLRPDGKIELRTLLR
jgi:hypothetical protein